VLTTWTMYTGGEDHAELSAIYFRSGATD